MCSDKSCLRIFKTFNDTNNESFSTHIGSSSVFHKIIRRWIAIQEFLLGKLNVSMTWNKYVRVDFLWSNCILVYVDFPVRLINFVIRCHCMKLSVQSLAKWLKP